MAVNNFESVAYLFSILVLGLKSIQVIDEMELDTPTWLDACYVQKVLRKTEKDESIEVSSIFVKPAVAKGDNYASDMHRVSVSFRRLLNGHEITEKRSLIAKVAPQGGIREEMILGAGFFETEMSMMSETLPQMSKILSELSETSLGARCLHVQYQKPLHLIIEDLAPKGFRMADRQAGLDLDHCLLAIRNLAAFHATSVALIEKDPKALTHYNAGMFHKDHSTLLGPFFLKNTRALGAEAAKWPELSPRIAEKISKLAEIIYEKACEATIYQKDDFNVLNHGDFWVNNMMFRYDGDQKLIDHTFVDFQTCCYGSPAIDVLYFLATSPSDDVRINHRDLILREYHTSLSRTMAKLKCKTEAPIFSSLQEALGKRAMCEVISSFAILPILLVDRSKAQSINELMAEDGRSENPAMQGKLFRKVMTRILPLYDSMGLLDE